MFDYAKKIKEYRERKFLTQEELAKLLGVNYVTELVGLFKKTGMKIDE